jgi:hypothetical protein
MLDEMEFKTNDVKNRKEIGEPKPYICAIFLANTTDVFPLLLLHLTRKWIKP